MKLSVERESDEQLSEIEAFVANTTFSGNDHSANTFVIKDECFHELLMRLSGYLQMLGALKKINARIQFVRRRDIMASRSETQEQHKFIVAALRRRDREETERLIFEHIAHRLDRIVENIGHNLP